MRIAALLRETDPAEKVVQSRNSVQIQMPSSFLNMAKYFIPWERKEFNFGLSVLMLVFLYTEHEMKVR